MKKIAVALGALGLTIMPALAQTAPAPAPAPCEGEAYHQFDFWVGDWEVTDPSGNLQGNNSITREEGGCLIVERWTSAAGNTGQSYNYYNPERDEWRQLWVSQGAIIDYTGGLTESGSMKLEGEITYHANSTKVPFTGEWSLNDDGSVTQHFEQYSADKDEWVTWFTGIYRRNLSDEL